MWYTLAFFVTRLKSNAEMKARAEVYFSQMYQAVDEMKAQWFQSYEELKQEQCITLSDITFRRCKHTNDAR